MAKTLKINSFLPEFAQKSEEKKIEAKKPLPIVQEVKKNTVSKPITEEIKITTELILSEDEKEYFEERAGIIEFEGLKLRDEAERFALYDVLESRKTEEMSLLASGILKSLTGVEIRGLLKNSKIFQSREKV